MQRDAVFVDAETGAQVEVWFRRTHDPSTRCLQQELVYRSHAEPELPGGDDGRGGEEEEDFEERSILTLRYADPLETERLLESSGFQIQALCGDFTGNPFEGAGEQIWIARKA